jgi:hypothetical protein
LCRPCQVAQVNHEVAPGILNHMNGAREMVWQYVRGALPYPDLLRRSRMRRGAGRLITCKRWPGADATGTDAAQLALLRLLYLQQLTRSAVIERRSDDAAMLARAAIETVIVGLYCLHSGDAIADLSTTNYRPSEHAGSYLSDAGLRTQEAVSGAVTALGELGPDLKVRDLALWLERERELGQAATLYHVYYVPLSHLFSRAYAFSLIRHVNPSGTLRRRPVFQWTRCSAARVADGCAGLLAANIADVAGAPTEAFLRYATAHFDRALAPALTFAVKAARRARPLRAFPAALIALAGSQASAAGPRHSGDAGQQDPAKHGGFAGTFDDLAAADGGRTLLTTPASEETTPNPGWNDDPETAGYPRHRRPHPG